MSWTPTPTYRYYACFRMAKRMIPLNTSIMMTHCLLSPFERGCPPLGGQGFVANLLQKRWDAEKLRPLIMDAEVDKATTVYGCYSSEGEAHTEEQLMYV